MESEHLQHCQLHVQFLLFSLFFFGHMAFGVLLPPLGIKNIPPALEAQSPNHWTAREVPM